MRQEVAEEEAKCFARWDWEEQLPSPQELVPLSQALIAPDLALAFGIPSSSATSASFSSAVLPEDYILVARHDASDLYASGGGGEEDPEPPRTLKRPRLVWTPQLHKRFVDAVAHLGIANAVPKTIMQIMGVEGLTRENVASHLQKYRLYLKRVKMQGLAAASPSPSASPHPFLGRAAPADPFLPYMPAAMLQQQQHRHHHKNPDPTQQHYYHQNQLFLNRPAQGQPVARPAAAMGPGMVFVPAPTTKPAQSAPLVSDSEWNRKGEEDDAANGGARKRELTLFPTG